MENTGKNTGIGSQNEQTTCHTAVRYQTICSVCEEGSYCTYGLLCLEDRMGSWVQLDLIEDVSLSRDSVLYLAARFNELQLSPLHFRDAVLDSISA